LHSKEKYKVVGEMSMDNIISTTIDAVNTLKAGRIVLDSISALAMHIELRKNLHRLCNFLLNLNCTSILTTEMDEHRRKISRYGIEEFLGRGAVLLDIIEDERGTTTRTIKIRKMREVDHDLDRRPMKISGRGITVYPEERVFIES
jgi:KaiC/GvpD/RAD55 family RecA-like ATPase